MHLPGQPSQPPSDPRPHGAGRGQDGTGAAGCDETVGQQGTASSAAGLPAWLDEPVPVPDSEIGPADDDEAAEWLAAIRAECEMQAAGVDPWLAGMPPELRAEIVPGLANAAEAFPAGLLHSLGGDGAGFAAGGAADTCEPGRALMALTEQAWADGLDSLPDDDLIGVLCAARRLASRNAALEVAAIAELDARRAREAGTRPQAERHTCEELAAALTLTSRAAGVVLARACGIARLPQVAAALAAGRIDYPRAAEFADQLIMLDDRQARQAAAGVLDEAGVMTTTQIRHALRRRVAAIDPEALRKRREAARKEARVELWDEAGGTSALAGRDLDTAAAIAADARLSALARWLKGQGAEGTISYLRSQVYLALLEGRSAESLLAASYSGSTAASAAGASSRPQAGAPIGSGTPGWPGLSGTISLTMPLSAWAGLTDHPGEVSGAGPMDAETCRDLAGRLASGQATRWHLTITDQAGRALGHACTRAGPGPPGSLASLSAWLARARIEWLEASRCGHSREVRSYRPSRKLRHLVRTRQRTCCYPGCRRPAAQCDDEHTTPFHKGGKTCECNLSPVCRRHHRTKQAPGWQLSQPEPGHMTWTLPHGRSYTTLPPAYPI